MSKYALVFSGASTKLPIHVGAWKAVLESKIEYDELWGTSAGAIVAAAIAAGYSYESLEKIVLNVDFARFMHMGLLEFGNLNSSGFVDGFELYNFFIDLYRGESFSGVGPDLNIIAHCLNDQTYKVFNKKSSPDMALSLSCRLSSGVPILFKPMEHEGKWWIDGGISKDFPVDLVKSNYVFGSFISAPPGYNHDHTGKLKMIGVLIDNSVHANCMQSISAIRKRPALKDFIFCESLYNKSLLDFSVSYEEKIEMIDFGYKNAMEAIGNAKRIQSEPGTTGGHS